jgi:hypothetical protein
MGIDRIGKGAPPAPPTPGASAEKAGPAAKSGPSGEVTKTFEVRPSPTSTPTPSTGSVAPTAATAPSTPLERLRAGEIDLDRYLDLKVDDATAHLQGLRAHEMESLRTLLREQLSSDPGLVELVQQATGQIPAPKG